MTEIEQIAVVVGTRPEIVKLSGIIGLLGDRAWVIHTGQHWDDSMFGTFLGDLGIGRPATSLHIGGATRGEQIGEATIQLTGLFEDRPPTAVVVQGDTNTVVGGALAANSCNLPLVHIEAGLRSFDRAMPEEHNRVVTDHLADLCLAPTGLARDNLLREAVPADRIEVTGNTVVDAVMAMQRGGLMDRDNLQLPFPTDQVFVLATFHRPENVDDPAALREVLVGLEGIDCPVLLPLHPRTRANIERFGLGGLVKRTTLVGPVGYREFLALATAAALLVSDSGGVQEEVSVLKRPALIVRRSTERPEVLGTFAHLTSPGPALSHAADELLADRVRLLARLADEPSPYGDGSASIKSVQAIERLLRRQPAG
jgi:UDP-N-acetylglucosamine 2-epimerase (non-hydrolysing)